MTPTNESVKIAVIVYWAVKQLHLLRLLFKFATSRFGARSSLTSCKPQRLSVLWIWSDRSENLQEIRVLRDHWLPRVLLVCPGSSWSCMLQCVSLWSEWQQQVLLTPLMVIRTKQIIGLKLGSCFLLLPAAAACLSTNNLITELGSACAHTLKQTDTHTPADTRTLCHRGTVSFDSAVLLITQHGCWKVS